MRRWTLEFNKNPLRERLGQAKSHLKAKKAN
jgi:hypothetical protein